MKHKSIFLLLLVIVSLSANAQYINITGDSVLCSGATTNLSVSIDSAIYETTSYAVDQIPFSFNNHLAPDTLNNGIIPDDYYFGPFDIGFDFCFYGGVWNQFYVGSNGWVSFSPISLSSTGNSNFDPWITAALPNLVNVNGGNIPRNCIMPCWRDWQSYAIDSSFIVYEVMGAAPDRSLMITWRTGMFGFSCDSLVGHFQVVLHETTNIVDVNLSDVPVCTAWPVDSIYLPGSGVMGMQNMNTTLYNVVSGRNATPWSASMESWRFSPSGVQYTDVSWLDQDSILIGTGSNLNYTINTDTIIYCELQVCGGAAFVQMVFTQASFSNPVFDIQEIACYGERGSIITIPTQGVSPFSYVWINSNGNFIHENLLTGNSDTIADLSPGTYYCSIIDASFCLDVDSMFTLLEPDSLQMTTTIIPVDTINNILGSISADVTGGTPPYNYTWSTGEATPSIYIALPGMYSLTVKDIYECGLLVDVIVPQLVSIENIESDHVVSIYPNPVSKLLYVSSSDFMLSMNEISLLTMQGKVLNIQVEACDNAFAINVSSLPKGIYYLKINGKQINWVRPILVH